MVILTMAKFLGNLRKDSILSLFDTTNIIFCLGSLFASKMPLVNFFLGHMLFVHLEKRTRIKEVSNYKRKLIIAGTQR